jgi:hypothetical protein
MTDADILARIAHWREHLKRIEISLACARADGNEKRRAQRVASGEEARRQASARLRAWEKRLVRQPKVRVEVMA